MSAVFSDNRASRITVGMLSIFLLWELIPRIFSISEAILPPCSKVLMTIYEQHALLRMHLVETIEESIFAFVIAFATAAVLASIMEEYKWAERLLLYPTIAFQNVPKVAIAPLLVIWLQHGMAPKIAMGVLIAFFPLFQSFRTGLQRDRSGLRNAISVLGCPKLSLLLKIKIPEAVPYIMTGAKVGMTFAIIGVIVGEMVQPSSGLGFLIEQGKENFQTTLQFASVFLVSLIGLGMYGLIVLIEEMPFLRKFKVEKGE